MQLTAKGGRVVVTNIHPMAETDVTLSLTWVTLLEKQIVGTIFGSANIRYDIPHLLELYDQGQLDLDRHGHPELQARGDQPGLRRHARRQEHPGCPPLRVTGRMSWASPGPTTVAAMSGDTAFPTPTNVTLSPPRRGEPERPSIDPSEARGRIHAAESALLDERRLLTGDELAGLAALPDAYVTSLAALAHQVRLAWCGPEVEVEGILSAKTGGCPEDCHFCSQSSRFDTPVKATPFLDADEVLQAAEETKASGASEFCIVLAVRGPDERTMQRLLELVPLVQERTGLNVAVSAGLLTEDQARRFAAAGVHRYNHNLETARSFFPNVVTTHTWEEREPPAGSYSTMAWNCAAARSSEWARPTSNGSSC